MASKWRDTAHKGIALIDTRNGNLVCVSVYHPMVTWNGLRDDREYAGTVFRQVEVRLQMRELPKKR